MTDEIFFKNLDFIEKMQIPFCIFNNSLLSIYRDNTIFPAADREAVFLLWCTDRFMMRNNPNFVLDNFGVTGLGAINLKDLICTNYMIFISDKIVINPYRDYFFVFEKDIILPFSHINYKGRTIPIPNKTEEYLAIYYGDWKTPLPPEKWDYMKDCKSMFQASGVDEAIKIYESTITHS